MVYTTVSGVLCYGNSSGSRTKYLTDALGSVTATVNSSGEIVNTYRYKPYEQLLAKTGTGEDPRYLWSGNTGSRRTLVTYAEQYNQARHYGSKQAGWTTVDPLWPEEAPYAYCTDNPLTHNDPTGEKDCRDYKAACTRPDLIQELEKNCILSGSRVCFHRTDLDESVRCGRTVCCGECFKKCDAITRLGGVLCLKTDPVQQLKCAEQAIKRWLKAGDQINKKVPPKIDPSKNCPPCTPSGRQGYHYQWQCSPASKGVITASCCPCYHQGLVFVVCFSSQGCHNNK